MGSNKKVLSKAVSELDKAKAPGKPRDIIVDPAGQWKYPGQETRIPGNDITMQGVPYPVWAQPNVGPGSMMQPNQDYNFPGASYVDETPMVKKGGTLQSKKYSKSMSATNKLFAKNKLFQNKKSKIFDPNAEFKTGGSKLGTINLNPNPLSHYELNYGFNLPTKQDGGENEDEYMDLTDEEIQAYRDAGYEVEEAPEYEIGGYVQHELVKAQNGKTVKPLLISDPKKYAYRKTAYDDSLKIYNIDKNVIDLSKKNAIGNLPDDVYFNNAKLIMNYQDQINKIKKNSKVKHNMVKLPGNQIKGDIAKGYKKPVEPVNYIQSLQPIDKKPVKNIPPKNVVINKPAPAVQENNIVGTLVPRTIQQFVTPSAELQPTNFQTIPKKPQGPRYGTLAGDENLNLPENYTQQQREAARKKRDADEFTRKTLEYQAKQRGAKAPVVQMFQKGGALDKAQGGKTVYSGPKFGLVGPSIPKTNGAPTIANAKILEAERKKAALAKQQAIAKQKEDALMKRMPKPQVSDNTRTVVPKQVVSDINNAAFYNSPQETAKREARKKEQAAFEKEQWNKYNKMSFAEKALDRTQAAIAHPILMAGNALTGNQAYIPGMGRGLMNTESPEYDKYLKATGQTKGQFEVSDLANIVNPGYWGGHAGNELHKGNYATGLLEAGLAFTGVPGSGRTTVQGVKSLAQDVNQGAKYLDKTLGTETGLVPLQTQRLNKIANITNNANSTTKGTDYIWKNVDKNIVGELPEGITKQQIADVLESKVSWIESPEYAKRRMATTGETLEEVANDVQKLKTRYENTKIHFKPIKEKEKAAGFYQSTPFRPSKDMIVVDPARSTSLEDMLGTLDHEIDHALSPAQKNNKLYNNYPFMPTDMGDAVRAANKKWPQSTFSKFIKGDKSKVIPYLEQAPEQQVRFNRLNQKIREDLNLTRNEGELTTAQFDEWVNKQKNNNFESLDEGHNDVVDLLLNKSKSMDRPAILKILNEAWSIAPVVGITGALGAGALKQEKTGGVTETWEGDLTDDEIKALEAAGYTIERIK